MRQFSETHFVSNYTIRKLMLDDLSKHLIAVSYNHLNIDHALIKARHNNIKHIDG